MVLPYEREPIDTDRVIAAMVDECTLQRRKNSVATTRTDPARQRHMKPELMEQIRVTSAIEIVDLVLRVAGGVPAVRAAWRVGQRVA